MRRYSPMRSPLSSEKVEQQPNRYHPHSDRILHNLSLKADLVQELNRHHASLPDRR